jgi:hypothetical protein
MLKPCRCSFAGIGLTLAAALFAVLLANSRRADADEVVYPPKVSEQTLREIIAKAELARPRLLMGPADVQVLRERAKNDPAVREVAQAVLRDADAMLPTKPIERIQEGRRLLGQSRRAVRRLVTLGMAYQLTGRQAYATAPRRRCWRSPLFRIGTPATIWTWPR